MDEKDQRFLKWLLDHGATFPKILWPSQTPHGWRGAVAIDTINPGDHMLCIPQCLMISEETCLNDPDLKLIYSENSDIFCRDDPVITLFLMREMILGEKSFYFPYLSILPYPETIQDWTMEELEQLQDTHIVEAVQRRHQEIQSFYDRMMHRLSTKYREQFSVEEYTFEKFEFAWKTIQARTFGRRLPWTALVPLADCLNHQNVATKYDFNIDGNGFFRLFPSASTTFEKGCEVFNSYGRRPNFQLLLDYGFALENNEWNYVDVILNYDKNERRLQSGRRFRIDFSSTLEETLPHARLACTSEEERLTLQRNGLTYIQPISIENEKKALQWLAQTLQCALDKFNTSLEKDSQQLQQEDLVSRLRTAIIYRCGRMKILNKYIQCINSTQRFLKCENLEREQILSAVPADLQRYLRQLTNFINEKK